MYSIETNASAQAQAAPLLEIRVTYPTRAGPYRPPRPVPSHESHQSHHIMIAVPSGCQGNNVDQCPQMSTSSSTDAGATTGTGGSQYSHVPSRLAAASRDRDMELLWAAVQPLPLHKNIGARVSACWKCRRTELGHLTCQCHRSVSIRPEVHTSG